MNTEPWATELDQLLAEWRTIHQLDASQAEQIRQTIMAQATEGMSDEWWRQYAHYLTAVIQQAKQFSTNVQFNFGYASKAPMSSADQRRSSIATPVQWQPYLKLA